MFVFRSGKIFHRIFVFFSGVDLKKNYQSGLLGSSCYGNITLIQNVFKIKVV